MVCKVLKKALSHVTVRQVRAIKKLWKEFTYPAVFVCFACLFVVLFICFFALLNNMKSHFGFIYAHVFKEIYCFFRFIRS